MINFKKLREQALRQQQRHDEGLSEGDSVMSSRTGVKGTIHRVGGNYATKARSKTKNMAAILFKT